MFEVGQLVEVSSTALMMANFASVPLVSNNSQHTLPGKRGRTFLESGYVYAPYIPVQVSPMLSAPQVASQKYAPKWKDAIIVRCMPEDRYEVFVLETGKMISSVESKYIRSCHVHAV